MRFHVCNLISSKHDSLIDKCFDNTLFSISDSEVEYLVDSIRINDNVLDN